MHTRQQILAQQVYQHIHTLNTDPSWSKDHKDAYGRVCLRFPALLHASGLCQSIAFFQSHEDQPEFKRFLTDLSQTLGVSSNWEIVRSIDVIGYQMLTRKTMQAANWYKRYAEAILKIEPTGSLVDHQRGDD